MKIKNLKKCLAGTLSFLMVSSITMLPASALSYPTDLSMAQLNFSVSNTVSAPKNNLSAMYNSRASGMASSAVKTNAGYENQGGTPSAYGKTAQDVYNEVGDKNFIANSGWQAWGSQNASSMPTYDSLTNSKQTAAENGYNTAVSKMPETAANAANLALSDLLSNNVTAATVYDKAISDYASTSLAKALEEGFGTSSIANLSELEAEASKISILKNFGEYYSSENIIKNTNELGERTDTPTMSSGLYEAAAKAWSNPSGTGISVFSIPSSSSADFKNGVTIFSGNEVNWDEILADTDYSAEAIINNLNPLTDTQKEKLALAGITPGSVNYTAEYADSLNSIDLKNKVTANDNALSYITGEGTNQEIFGFDSGDNSVAVSKSFDNKINITEKDMDNMKQMLQQRAKEVPQYGRYGNDWLAMSPEDQLNSFKGVK